VMSDRGNMLWRALRIALSTDKIGAEKTGD
jgi:hypothetical protein